MKENVSGNIFLLKFPEKLYDIIIEYKPPTHYFLPFKLTQFQIIPDCYCYTWPELQADIINISRETVEKVQICPFAQFLV